MVEPYLSQMTPERIAEFGQRYRSHPLRMVQIEDVLPDHIADTVSGLLTSGTEFGSVYGLHKTRGHVVDRDSWLNAEEENRFFHYEMMSGSKGQKFGKENLTFLKLRQFLSSDEFCAFVRDVTDQTISSVTRSRVHRLKLGHYLRPHHDRSGARTIAYILYLSRDWHKQFGGQLTLVGSDGFKEHLEPNYNSLILFDVTQNKEHYIEELTIQSKGFARDTMSGWFLNEAKK
ncbi:MAG: 2OG-Fe(II) oxygenase family protein [Roseobacter sp.]|uniref:2OG-Fe(II) oxygenase family protein n=1 Tax=Parasphingorhabdus sp. TaxID=2709688 RepID=UPI003265474E